MRLFIALNLPEAEKERLWDAMAGLRASAAGIRWTAPESVHLTLKFLGEVGDGHAERLETRLAQVTAAHDSMELRLGGVGAFPSIGRARVWWLGIEAGPALGSLQADVDAVMAEEGFPREARPFAPHLTIGRAARDARPVPAAAARELAASAGYTAAWRVETLDLMRSHLHRDGARYEAIARAPLRRRAAMGAAERNGEKGE